MKRQIKKKLIVMIELLIYCSSINILSNQNFNIVNQDSIIEEQQKISLKQRVLWQEPVIFELNSLSKPKEKEEETYIKGYTTTRVNIRKSASTSSEILNTLDFNTPILYMEDKENEEWLQIKYEDDTIAYISKKYISNIKCEYREYQIPKNDGFKSYMSYTTITSTISNQYKIQNSYAYTGTYGIRQVQDRFCIALGTYFDSEIGQCVDLVLENGVIIPCVLGDVKANIHTDNNNLFTIANGCCSEFIIDSSKLNSNAKRDGNISSCNNEWNSPVAYVRVYEKNILK